MSQQYARIRLRRATASEWSSSSPQPNGEVLKLGEPGYEKDTGKLKIGDGVTGWNNLEYFAGGASLSIEQVQDSLGTSFLVAGSGIGLNYDDENDTLTINSTGNANTGDITFNGTTISTIDPDQNITINSNGNGDIILKEWEFKQDGTLNLPEGKTLNFGQNTDTLGPPIEGGGTDRVRLWDFKGGGSNYNYAIGVEGNHIWFSMDVNNGTGGYKYYSRDNEIFKISDDSKLVFPNGTWVSPGTFDNGTSGNSGVSLNCAVGYELNWQGGHLKSTYDNGITATNILADSALEFPGIGVDNMQIDNTGLTFPDGTIQTTAAIIGLNDTNTYIFCKTGDDLVTKYAEAKLLTPGGDPLSSTNRATLIIMPGVYPLTEQLEINGEYVDVIGLGSSNLDRGCNVAVTVTNYDINVSANDVRLKGIGTTPDHSIKIYGDKPLQVFEQCKGGDDSYLGIISGTFTNCSAGNYGFGGGGGTVSGYFTNCSAGNYGFGGGYGTVSGYFTNCSAGDNGFGSFGGTASGSFTNCSAGNYGFGGSGIASGYFTNCSGGNNSFGGWGGLASGIFLRCTLTSGSFPSLTYPGIQRLCIDGSYNVINSDAPTP